MLAQQAIQFIAGNTRGSQLRLDFRALLQSAFQLCLGLGNRRLALGDLPEQLQTTHMQILELLLQPAHCGDQRRVRRAPRFHLDRQFARVLLRRRRRVSRLGQFQAHAFAILLQLHALRLERREGIDRGLHARARGAQLRFAARQLHTHVGKLGLQLLQAARRIVVADFGGAQFGAAVDMFAVQPIYFRLAALAAVFMLTDPLAGALPIEFPVP